MKWQSFTNALSSGFFPFSYFMPPCDHVAHVKSTTIGSPECHRPSATLQSTPPLAW